MDLKSELEENKNWLSVFCPYCDTAILIQKNEINCNVMRHGVYIDNKIPGCSGNFFFQMLPFFSIANSGQLNPHMPQSEVDKLVAQGVIFGCGNQFGIADREKGTTEKLSGYQ
jgi:hypothetical protein